MTPSFDIDGGVTLVLARGLFDAALLSAFGSALFPVAIARPVPATATFAAWRFATGSAIAALALSIAWLLLQSASLADETTIAGVIAAAPAVVWTTSFGHLWSSQVVLLAATAWASRAGSRPVLATTFAALAVILQALHGHAAAMEPGPSLLAASAIAHLLGAGAWLGGLAPLAWLVATQPAGIALRAARRFSVLGTACVAVIAATALLQSSTLIGGVAGWIGTAYGLTALLKLALFATLLAFAVVHRFALTPALVRPSAEIAKRRLARSIGVEAFVGLLVVLAAGLLSGLPPSMHVQPVWPFAWQPSFSAIDEDADFRREVIEAAAALACAVSLLMLAIAVRRVRWPSVIAALVIVWFAIPHFSLLRAEAYPTSFYRSPTGFSPASIVAGEKLFATNCAGCHGADGRGDGAAAKGARVPPANLTADHIWAHPDGELFWWLLHGIDDSEGGLAMPGFPTLSDDQRWALIDYVRAHAAGVAMTSRGEWVAPLQAPGLTAACADGRTLTNDDLRGRAWRIVVGDRPVPGDVPTIRLAESGQLTGCADPSDETRAALAIVVGIPANTLDGTQLLVDANGWLRARALPGEALDLTPTANPVTGMSSGIHHH